jgi:hypothetical protein
MIYDNKLKNKYRATHVAVWQIHHVTRVARYFDIGDYFLGRVYAYGTCSRRLRRTLFGF